MKKWLNLFLIVSSVSFVFSLFVFNFHSVQAQSGVSISAKILGVCGNGILEVEETCDDGTSLNGQYGYCKADCSGLGPRCGDGIIQSGDGEECDDGNISSGDGCNSNCLIEPPPLILSGAPGLPYPREPVTKVILQGKAYPYASVFTLKDGNIVASSRADSLAVFKIEINNLIGGAYTFGLWAEDKAGRKSITFSFTVTVSPGTTIVIGDILIPPTIEIEKSQLEKGELLHISGQTAPQSEISLYIKSLESQKTITNKIKANQIGDWAFSFDASLLDGDSYSIKANALSPERLVSSFSHVLEFVIGKVMVPELCPRADFNRDERTNLIDFSILLYWWGKYDDCVDQNEDGIVDLIDFSMLMYWWTG
jgi:cysteine-rich repeat protein